MVSRVPPHYPVGSWLIGAHYLGAGRGSSLDRTLRKLATLRLRRLQLSLVAALRDEKRERSIHDVTITN